LDDAFRNFFKGQTHFPRFKRRKNGVSSFTLTGVIRVSPNQIRLPRIGWVRLKERGYIKSRVHIHSAAVSERAGRWFVSVGVVERCPERAPIQGLVAGVDRGIHTLFMVSDGTSVENPRALRRRERKLRHLQRILNRKQKGSSNSLKTVEAIRRLHYRIANVRKDVIEKATTMLARTKSAIVVEDLNVKGMMANPSLAKFIQDASWSLALRQLRYKTDWYGSRLVVAPRWYPSTRRCSKCGNIKERMNLSDRTYYCEVCGLVMDRDLNAARNLEQWPGVARTLKMPVKGSVGLPYESGTTSLEGGPRPWIS
jgi:putative transposase